jgi:hypothetical protein
VAATGTEYPIRFVKSGEPLLVANPTSREIVLTVIDLASGRRKLWKRIPDDSASPTNQLLVATPDLKYYAYPFPRGLLGPLHGGKPALNEEH